MTHCKDCQKPLRMKQQHRCKSCRNTHRKKYYALRRREGHCGHCGVPVGRWSDFCQDCSTSRKRQFWNAHRTANPPMKKPRETIAQVEALFRKVELAKRARQKLGLTT